MKTASVIVTYNRKKLLAENVMEQLSQSLKPDLIIIIDNHGNDNTKEYLESNNVIRDGVKYFYLDENIGGAGGFSYGVNVAYEMGADFIWLMDDDGRPANNNTFENIMTKAHELYANNKKIMINSLVICEENKFSFTLMGHKYISEIIHLAKDGLFLDAISPFNGTLISRELVSEIGMPRKDFFIKGDEAEYTMRARNADAFIATVINSVYYHPSAPEGVMEAPWKEYYRSRNYTYMYYQNKKRIKAFALCILRVYSCIKLKTDKQTLLMIIRGYRDGKKGKLGKTVTP